MTENTPAEPEHAEAWPTRRGRRAAEASGASGEARGEAGMAPETSAQPAVPAAGSFDSPAAETSAADTAAGQLPVPAAPPSRRSARAELRSRDTTAVQANESDTNISTGEAVPPHPVLLDEPPLNQDGDLADEPYQPLPSAPEPLAQEDAAPQPLDLGFAVVLPEPPAEPPATSDQLPLLPSPDASERLPVPPVPAVFDQLPVLPSPAASDRLPLPPVQVVSERDTAAPKAERQPAHVPEDEQSRDGLLFDAAGSRDAAGAPELPLDPAVMPEDLRERTRAAVRGEPNDVRRATFLDTATAKIPASRGFRGFLASLGIRVAPSAKELAERRDTRMVSQHWPGPRTISVVNGKGGANKTPTTVMLAALFARNGGGPVLAWDNNETRGTLGWRTEQAAHDSTVMDLLPETGLLLSPVAQSAMLAKFVHHQTDDKYDVLRSNPNVLASEQKVTKADFDALHSVASKYFRLNIVDSGNDESAERWLRMIDHTDQLVIATTTVEEHAEAGALLLEALAERGGRYAELSRGAVVIVSQADRNGTEAQARKVAEAFKVLARAAVTIPYDPALVKGQIRFASLRPATQRAWLKAAAAVAGGL